MEPQPSKPTRPLMPIMVSPRLMSLWYAVRSHHLFKVLNCLHLVGVGGAIDGSDFALFKVDGDALVLFGCHLTQECAFWQILVAVQRFLTADACAPQAFVVTVFEFLEVAFETVGPSSS